MPNLTDTKHDALSCHRDDNRNLQTELNDLYVSLEGEKIDVLPVTAIECYQLPVSRNTGTTAQTRHIQV